MSGRDTSVPAARASRRGGIGFTLLELVIVVAAIAIIAAIALPSYQSAVNAGRRADGTTALLDLANRMQRYYSENNAFTGAAIGGTGFPATATSPQGYYTLSISFRRRTPIRLRRRAREPRRRIPGAAT